MAFRMQASVPDLTDLSRESEKMYDLYGPDSKTRGTFANSALMARRLVERGVRFVQIFIAAGTSMATCPATWHRNAKTLTRAATA